MEYEETFSQNIHSSTRFYNDREKPKMINPEIESVIKELEFYKGVIKSENFKVKYTIETCGLDRADLNEKRKKVIDVLVNKIKAKRLINQPIDTIISDLKEFIALRFWLLKNYKSLL
jgi:hypothetical protein